MPDIQAKHRFFNLAVLSLMTTLLFLGSFDFIELPDINKQFHTSFLNIRNNELILIKDIHVDSLLSIVLKLCFFLKYE